MIINNSNFRLQQKKNMCPEKRRYNESIRTIGFRKKKKDDEEVSSVIERLFTEQELSLP